MDRNEYIEMPPQKLYTTLISDVTADPHGAMELLSFLEASDRYSFDHEFRANVDSAKCLSLIMQGEYYKMINRCMKLIGTTIALELWYLLSFNLNIVANAYVSLGLFERALEYYYSVIENEQRHGLNNMIAISYNNIALIYLNLAVYDKANNLFKRSLEALKQGGEEQFRYSAKMIASTCNRIISLCYMNNLEEIPELFRTLECFELEKEGKDTQYSYYLSLMYYSFYTGEYDEAKRIYCKAKEIVSSYNTGHIMVLSAAFMELSAQFHRSYDFYIEELLAVEEIKDSYNAQANAHAYKELKQYYEYIGENEKAIAATGKYIAALEGFTSYLNDKQVESLQIVEDILESSYGTPESDYKDREFKLVAEEAVRAKNALQLAHDRLSMIHELGKRITSSLDLTEVVELIYQDLRMNLPTDVFVLMAHDPDRNCLRSVAYYELGRIQEPVSLSLDNDDSIFVRCYKKDKIMLYYDDMINEMARENKMQRIGYRDIHSVVFIPLKLGEKTVGVFTVQSTRANAYTEKDVGFLEELRPYLAIALNNALHSERLEREIEKHIETQSKLKLANQRLERLSHMDELTQISSRRLFEKEFLKMLRRAENRRTSVLVLMFDIDDFKIYNDTYGHLEGDEILKAVASVVNKRVHQVGGVAARFGGEEFVAACIGLSSDETEQLSRRIHQDIMDLGIKNEKSSIGRLTVSIGIACLDQPHTSDRLRLMRAADLMLYESKKTGKNRTTVKRLDEEPTSDV